MEKIYIPCPQCGRRLASLASETGGRRQLRPYRGARVRITKNALGESLAWIKCPKCAADKQVDPKYWNRGV